MCIRDSRLPFWQEPANIVMPTKREVVVDDDGQTTEAVCVDRRLFGVLAERFSTEAV